jgi:hypothetical protein
VKLVDRKRLLLMCASGLGAVGFVAFQEYRAKGFLNTIDIVSGVMTLIVFFSIVSLVTWWANRP